MPLTSRSKLKEVWQNPVGQQMLQNLLVEQGRSERWLQRPMVANMALHKLDRIAGAGFCDMVLEAAARLPEKHPCPLPEEKSWWREAIIYQLWLPSFMDSDHDGLGDFGGLIQRLPYLEKLGANALWLWPLATDRGGVTSYRQAEEEYGGNAAFEQLIKEAHARSIRVLMGVDIAATSDEHSWFAKALKGEAGGRYILLPGTAGSPPNNWTRSQQQPAWSWHEEIRCWGLHLGGRHHPDLNWDNAPLRAEMAAMLAEWAAAGVDGFCFSTISQLNKNGFEDGSLTADSALFGNGYEEYTYGPKLGRYLRELRAALPQPLLLAGEARGVAVEMAKQLNSGQQGLDLLIDPSHLGLLGRMRVDQPCLELAALKAYYLKWMEGLGSEQWMALFFETPVTPRIVSRLGSSPLYRAILAKLLALWMMTLRGTPMLYQGQELGLANLRLNSPSELRDPVALGLYSEACEPLGEGAAFQLAQDLTADHARAVMPWGNGDRKSVV